MKEKREKAHWIVGIDLSGPSKIEGTCAATFKLVERRLEFEKKENNATDKDLRDLVMGLEGRVSIGVDAPLSYNDGGGQRERDRLLRAFISEKGIYQVGVIAPTQNRMVYLTLRGIALAQQLSYVRRKNRCDIGEVHPGATLALMGAEKKWLKGYKKKWSTTDSVSDRRRKGQFREKLRCLLSSQDVTGLEEINLDVDHDVDACAAAVACRDWLQGRQRWIMVSEPPQHPYDLAC